jgi:ferric-dicitrate binding protein FerR (iron transport regulator)
MTDKLSFLLLVLLLMTACSQDKIITEDNYDVVELPDGSIVFLNQFSSLEYHEAFDQRKVAIEGECFFAVKSSDKSFTVIGELGEIEVLGTEFSVKSTSEDMEVEVEEGNVKFSIEDKSEEVSEGVRAAYSKNEKKITKSEASRDFRKWMAKLRIEFKKLDKTLNQEAKNIEKEINDKARKMEKEADKIGKELDEVGKQIGKSIKKLTK